LCFDDFIIVSSMLLAGVQPAIAVQFADCDQEELDQLLMNS
jgi:hypothetical protein